MTNIGTFREFCQAVSKGLQPVETRCTADTPKEVLELLECATKAAPWLSDMGISSKSSGHGNIQQNGFSFRAGAHTFTVMPPSTSKAKRPQAVTATSINAYHSIDLATARGNVAAAIFTYSRLGKDVTRKELEVWQKIASSSVCGRVKELLDLSEIHPFLFEGKPYRLQRTVARVSLCHGASDKVNEGLIWVEVISLPERAQLEMF